VAAALVPLLPNFLRLLAGLIRDPRVSVFDKGLLVGVIAYVLIPLDLVPDILGLLGWADDLFLLAMALRRLVLGAGMSVLRDHWTGSGRGLKRLLGGLDDLRTLVPGPVRRLLEGFLGPR